MTAGGCGGTGNAQEVRVRGRQWLAPVSEVRAPVAEAGSPVPWRRNRFRRGFGHRWQRRDRWHHRRNRFGAGGPASVVAWVAEIGGDWGL